MGHIRLGRLPKTRPWDEVADLLRDEPEDLPGLAGAILAASTGHLDRPEALSATAAAFTVLVRLAEGADNGTLLDFLHEIGVDATPSTPVVTVLADVSDRLRLMGSHLGAAGHFQEFASLALRRALLETVATQETSLLSTRIETLEAGLRHWSHGERFGQLTRLFFGDFLARVLQAAVDRELSFHTHAEGSFGDPGEAREFSDALDRYARETAAIVQRFATDWYALRHWHEKETISARQAANFSKAALTKLRDDLRLAREFA